MNPDYFNITFDRIGFRFDEKPMGARVLIRWQDKDLIGEIWSTRYSPERGYYEIGIRRVQHPPLGAASSAIWQLR